MTLSWIMIFWRVKKLTKNLKGSWVRDEFLYWHKQVMPIFDKYCYGGDLDFCMVRFKPLPRIMGIVDIKDVEKDRKISPTEHLIYNIMREKGFRVFIAVGDLRPIKGKWAEDIDGNPIFENIDLAVETFRLIRVWEYFGEGHYEQVPNDYIKFELNLRQGKL